MQSSREIVIAKFHLVGLFCPTLYLYYKWDLTGQNNQTELNFLGDKWELLVVYTYEEFSYISKIIEFSLVIQPCKISFRVEIFEWGGGDILMQTG